MLLKKFILGAVLVLAPLIAAPAVADAAPAAEKGVLASGATLTVGQSLSSKDGRYKLYQQADGGLVLRDPKGNALWSSNTGGVGVKTVMQEDGNLVQVSARGETLFDTQTGGNAGAFLAVQNDGGLVVYAKGGEPIWSRHMLVGKLPSGSVLKSGDVVRSQSNNCYFGLQEDGNVVLNRTGTDENMWKSGTAGNPGSELLLQPDGNLVLASASKKLLWATNTGGNRGAWLGVQDDCNVVLKGSGDKVLWSTGTHD